MVFTRETFVFDPRPSYPFLITANRYVDPASPHTTDPDAVTLVFAHGTSFHKEQWEPTMDELRKHSALTIREIWSIEAPNHGDSAVLNEEVLRTGYSPVFAWEEYARSLHLFLSGFGTGVNTDFSRHRLVGIGHSMGAVSLVLMAGHYPRVNFHSIVCCDLMCIAERFGGTIKDFLVGGAEKRRDIWPSKEEAYAIMKGRDTWKTWDDRVLRIFVESGLRPLPTSDYPDLKEGVTLKCSRIQEAACYRDPTGSARAYRLLPSFVKQTTTHLIYGAIDDYLPAAVKEDILEVVGGVANLGSFSRVPGAGHLIPQVNPKGLAEKIAEALVQGRRCKL